MTLSMPEPGAGHRRLFVHSAGTHAVLTVRPVVSSVITLQVTSGPAPMQRIAEPQVPHL